MHEPTSSQIRLDTSWTTTVDGNVGDQSTTGSSRNGVDGTSTPYEAGDEQEEASSPSVSSSSLKGSSTTTKSSPTPTKPDVSYSTLEQTDSKDAETTAEYCPDADGSKSMAPTSTVADGTSSRSELMSPCRNRTETTLGGGSSSTTKSTTAEKDQRE